ncbi:Ripening-related protein grip22 [Glycine soja]|uniref:Ripening-related protein grip22 n=1 Tax=Glycine soja TaxID=3848 RepID=A0A0B2RFW4_GLYSO|nr:Ripening-related protein grip22 [Glycine soja]
MQIQRPSFPSIQSLWNARHSHSQQLRSRRGRKCDGNFHPLPQRVVALSTGWYNHGARCGKMIRIKARNGRSTLAKVVDECDSVHGCDKSHACKTNVVDASKTVWKDLGLNTNDGEVPVTWTMV